MQNQLAKAVPAGPITTLPPRLAALARQVGTVQHGGQPLRYNLPGGVVMSDLERAEARTILSTLEDHLDADAPYFVEEQVFPGRQAKGALIARMQQGLAGPAVVLKEKADAQAYCYDVGTDTIPAWAIDSAIQRWLQHRCPYTIQEAPNYAFPPAPAVLRKMAEFDMEEHVRTAADLRKLLAALPLEEAMDPKPLPKTTAVATIRRM